MKMTFLNGLTAISILTVCPVWAHTPQVNGIAGGDIFNNIGLWANGVYNHTKYDGTKTDYNFHANTYGVVMGAGKKLSDAMTIGLGYAYADTSVDKHDADADIKSHQGFLYGFYQPSEWFAYWVMGYSYSKYKEDDRDIKYHTNSYVAELMSGYKFQSGFVPEAGIRYSFAKRAAYRNDTNRIKSDGNDLLTGVIGGHYQKPIYAKGMTFIPHANIALTYDLVSDSAVKNIRMVGGNYQIQGQRLHRFGTEAGAGLTMSVGAWDFSADYYGGYRKDFQSHTGMLKVKYNF